MTKTEIRDVGDISAEQIRDLLSVLASHGGRVTQEQDSNEIVVFDVAYAAKKIGLVKYMVRGSWASTEWYELTPAGRVEAGLPPKELDVVSRAVTALFRRLGFNS